MASPRSLWQCTPIAGTPGLAAFEQLPDFGDKRGDVFGHKDSICVGKIDDICPCLAGCAADIPQEFSSRMRSLAEGELHAHFCRTGNTDAPGDILERLCLLLLQHLEKELGRY